VLVKPDVEKSGARSDVIAALEAKGFVICAERAETLTAERAAALAPGASDAELAHLTSGPSCLLAVEKPFAIGDLAAIVGHASPQLAREAAPDSLRAQFGTDSVKNGVAVPLSSDEAATQLAVAFGPQAFISAAEEHTVAIVLPEATASGKASAVTDALRASGFKVISTKQIPLSAAAAAQLLPDVEAALVEYAQSGSSTAIALSRPHGVRALASIVGPAGAAVTSTLSAALGFESVQPNRSPVICPATLEAADGAMELLFPELGAMQTTLAIIKPDAVKAGATDKILQRIREAGFAVRARTSLTLPAFKAEEFYAEHKGKPFQPSLVAFMSSGPCVALALSRKGAIAEWRALMGPTATAKAREQAPGSLRALFGTDNTFNATHGSDSQLSARRELKFFFPSLSVEPLPNAEQVAAAVRDGLEPTLIVALTELCKAKPDDPVRWLGNYLLAHNPNKPKAAQLVMPHEPPKLSGKKIIPDLKVRPGPTRSVPIARAAPRLTPDPDPRRPRARVAGGHSRSGGRRAARLLRLSRRRPLGLPLDQRV
jgi:nucleoside diphosphate kinase